VVARRLEGKVEPIFHPDSYGYRPKRSALDAVGACRARCWKYDWVIDLHVAAFFDSVRWDLVVKAVEVHTDDPWAVLYVKRWLAAPARLIAEVRPARAARHVVFYAMDDKGLTEGEGRFGYFYGTIPLYLATNPQCILALAMNGAPLPVEHGAPLRLRVETQLGVKMVKWITGIEFVADVSDIGMGMGGWREDQQYYANAAGI